MQNIVEIIDKAIADLKNSKMVADFNYHSEHEKLRDAEDRIKELEARINELEAEIFNLSGKSEGSVENV
jgi:tetrahydromethanopterin S-methyltransferase subunit G